MDAATAGEDIEVPDNVADINKLDLLENILYCPFEVCSFMPKGDLYIKVADRDLFDCYSSSYEKYVEEQKNELTEILGDDLLTQRAIRKTFVIAGHGIHRLPVLSIGAVLQAEIRRIVHRGVAGRSGMPYQPTGHGHGLLHFVH